MLLQSLYEFAKNTKTRHGELLIDSAEFESRYIAWLIHLDMDGSFQGFIPLITDEEPGTLYDKLPRTLEPKDSGTVAEFLVEDMLTILGLGESPAKTIKDKAMDKHNNFWQRIHNAANELDNPELKILMKWKENIKGYPAVPSLVYEKYKKSGGRGEGKEQWVVVLPSGEKMQLHFRQNTSIDATFKVGNVLPIEDEKVLSWWSSWYQEWLRKKEDACFLAHGGGGVCSITGDVSVPMSNSHLPKLKLPKSSGANSTGCTLASAESDSFHSYGLSEQLEKIPGSKSAPDASYTSVSVKGAIAYCNALNYLLSDDNHHISVGPVVFCFWCKRSSIIPGLIGQIFRDAYPDHVKKLLSSQFAGAEPPEVLRQEHLYTLALSGNAGRAMVKQWIDQTLDDAILNLNQWWQDLQVMPFYSGGAKKTKKANAKESPSPYRIYALAETTLRRSKNRKNEKLIADRVIQLYLAALKGSSLQITLLKPILDEFQSALVKDSEEERIYPFSTSRFALIKLILIRNPNRKEGDFMPTYELADTPDPAYNLGRLLAVFENLQNKYHNYERKGAGVVERYYGTASSAPASAFPLLCRLARHHLSKLKKGDEKDKAAAYVIEKDIAEIFSKFQSTVAGQPPVFPRLLTLENQGKFALGFYQQKAKPRQQTDKQTDKQSAENNRNNTKGV